MRKAYFMAEKIRKHKEELIIAAIFFPIYVYFFWCCLPINGDGNLERILYLTFSYITFAMAFGEIGKKDGSSSKSEAISSNMLLVIKTVMFIMASLSFYGTMVPG